MTSNIEEDKYYVYHIINPITFRLFYVGKGEGYRCRQHLTDKREYAHNKRLNGYIRNLIENNTPPTIIKIAENLIEEYAYELEELEIKKYGRVGFEENGILLNILESGRPPSFRGEDHPFYGKIHTEETKRKISETKKKQFSEGMIHPLLGKKHTEESKEKNRQKHLGKKLSPETIEKIRNANIGKEQTDYQKQKAREANEKTWKIITPEGEEVIITNLRQYSLERGLDPGNMMHVAAGRQKQHKGYKVFKLT
tara:strand:+ start:234 stop:992 length:759 start_codon:yes stop_codon:yes gene_type:complete